MNVTIFAAGSRGDIQPCVALAKGLMAAHYRVRLAAPADFGSLVARHDVDLWPLRGDVQAIMASAEGRQFMEAGGGNPLRSIRAMRTLMAPVVMQMAEDALAACRDADGLVCLGVFAPFGRAICTALHLPQINVEPTPLLPTRAFAAASWPIQHNLGGLHNRVAGVAMLGSVWLWYRTFVADLRQRLGLPPYGFGDFLHDLRATPLLGAYSPTVIPRPPDWPPSAAVTGYLLLDDEPGWQPPPSLAAFLAAGDPPVYVGFGSMAGQRPEEMAALVVAALRRCGRRGLLATGWGGLQAGDLPDSVYLLDAAPHAWLFPRMAAVVHHGGAGTTAEGLRAGVPNVIVPFILDQPFWGQRVKALGVGPTPLPRKQLTAERLAQAIDQAVTDRGMRSRAAAVGAAIRAEDGVGNAVRFVSEHWGIPAAAQEEREA